MTVRRKAARKGKKAAATTSKLAVALRERKEAIEQQAATAEILKVISSSPRDRLPAFDAILKSALRLCDAHLGVLSLREADGLRTVAQRGGSAEFAAWVFERGVFKPDGGAVLKAVRAGKAFQVADALQGADYLARKPNITRFIDLGGVRTFLAVPLLKDGEVIGNIGIYRREVRPFTDRQIVLVKTFADQAVIAIENARLFNDTKEALEQQTATAEILRVISSSPSDMQPVFDSILEHAMRLCDAGLGTVGLYDGQAYRHRAQRGGSPEYVKRLFDEPFVPHPDGTLGRMIAERGPVHIPDYREIPAYRRREPRAVATVELGGARTYLAVPMLKDGQVLGGITIRRTDVRPFTQRQIDLLSTFASQAVIAIENVRLFNETRESLERQTATAEILKVISSSPTDVQPVFDVIVERAVRLCGARFGRVYRYDGSTIQMVASHGLSAKGLGQVQRIFPRPAADDTIVGRVILGRRPCFIEDIQRDETVPPLSRQMIEALGTRRQVTIPMLRGGEPIGAITVGWDMPAAFDDQQMALLQAFADQAVIAVENVRLFNETKDALEQQTATAEILQVISGTPTDTQPVFDAIARSALEIFGGMDVSVGLVEGDAIQIRAGTLSSLGRGPGPRIPLSRDSCAGLANLDRAEFNIADIEAPGTPPLTRERGRLTGWRSIALVPMIREGVAIGHISIHRQQPVALDAKQFALLRTFANQAVIAIENVRLFNETKEALERQTGTAEILRAISSSPTDLRPVFDSILENATRLCDAHLGVLNLVASEKFKTAAHRGASPEYAKWLNERDAFEPVGSLARAIAEKRPIHTSDMRESATYRAGNPFTVKMVELSGARTFLTVPLLLKGETIGNIGIYRSEVRPFSEKQIELVSTFADQAVIAIENVRLFNETKEALERQTATSEVLRTISRSTFDLNAVLQVLIENATRLAGAQQGFIFRFDGEVARLAYSYNAAPAYRALIEATPLAPGRGSLVGRTLLERRAVHIPDALADPEFTLHEAQRAGGFRSMLGVPMMREGKLIGVIAVWATEVKPFTEKQIELVSTFADQAVIAIENVRLFNETKEALEQQTATAKILGVMSSSPTDVQPVLDAVAESAARLCETDDAVIRRVDPDGLRRVAHFGPLPAPAETDVHPLVAGSVGGRAVLERRAIHVEDMEEELRHGRYPEARVLAAAAGWYRSMLAMPLVREDTAIGVILIRRKEFRPFTDKQIALLKTFADQAVIAIENVRLFNETKEALERQTATAEILRVISSSPTDVKPVFDTILSNGARLCEANFAALYLYDGEMLTVPAHQGALPELAEAFKTLRLAPSRAGAIRLAALERRIVQVADITKEPGFKPEVLQIQSARTVLGIPLLREKTLVGVLAMWRTEVRPFTDKQIVLLKTFADQAVIAIENVRLFKELQSQTEALTKSVSQLTALGEVGQAISSTLDLETVLKTIVARAVQLTGLDGGSIYEYDEQAEEYHLRATENYSAEVVEVLRRAPVRRNEGPLWQAGLTGQPTQIAEMRDESYQTPRREFLLRTGYRALLVVPLMRENRIVGALAVTRKAPGAFAPEVVELLKTFATQSALAIQNARLFREIAEKGRQLEVASQHKSQFLASMSHELRTPLNALLGFNEMLLGDIYGEVPGDMRPPLAQMQSSGKHLLRLINNVLDLAKIEAGRMELALAEYSVHDTVESVRSTLQPLAADKGLEFSAAVPADIPLAYGDPGRITQCLMNLAGNSLKFTKAGKVEISVAADNGLLRYRVADTGIGIPPDKIEGLFTEFKQTDATVASEYGGTGLGLSISKKFVEMHGGRIWAESEPGRGSVFTFEVPLRAKTT